MESVTLKVNKEIANKIKDFYLDKQIENKGEYISFSAKSDDVVINIYDSKKEKTTITFIGKGALEEAKIFDTDAKINEVKKDNKKFIDYQEQIGSDEVGVGDFLLPIIVVASFIKESQMKRIKELGIADSKKLTDSKIRELGPTIIKEFEFSKLTLTNEKYNEVIVSGENLNSIKAKMHNKALLNLSNKYPDVFALYVDQFVSPSNYYNYLKGEKEILKGISFMCKGESLFPCVALASVIARYSFLLEKDKLEKKYNMTFPCGASKKVDEFAKEFIDKFGEVEFSKICKQNFINYKKAQELI